MCQHTRAMFRTEFTACFVKRHQAIWWIFCEHAKESSRRGSDTQKHGLHLLIKSWCCCHSPHTAPSGAVPCMWVSGCLATDVAAYRGGGWLDVSMCRSPAVGVGRRVWHNDSVRSPSTVWLCLAKQPARQGGARMWFHSSVFTQVQRGEIHD